MQIEKHSGQFYEVNIFYRIPVAVEEIYPGPTTANIFYWSEQEKLFREIDEYIIKVQNGLETWDNSSMEEFSKGSQHQFVNNEN